jgi:hypothetical protein
MNSWAEGLKSWEGSCFNAVGQRVTFCFLASLSWAQREQDRLEKARLQALGRICDLQWGYCGALGQLGEPDAGDG